MSQKLPTHKSVRTRRGRKTSSLPEWMSLSNNLFFGLLCAFLVLTLIGLLSIRRGPPTSLIESEDVGSIATKDVRAVKDFTYNRIDAEATALLAEEKAAEIARVYEWDVLVTEATYDHVAQAFDFMRQRLDAARREYQASATAVEDTDAALRPGRIDLARHLQPLLRLASERAATALLLPGQRGLYARIEIAAARSAYHLEDLVDARRNAAFTQGAVSAVLGTSDAVISLMALRFSLDERLETVARSHLKDFNARLFRNIDEELFNVLVRHRFNNAVEGDFLVLLKSVLDRKIVEGHWVFGKGKFEIVVERRRGDEIISSERVTRLEQIRELDDVLQSGGVLESQAEIALAGRSREERKELAALARQFVRPTLSFDPSATERARDLARSSVPDLVDPLNFKKGQVIVQEGQPITDEHVQIYEHMMGQVPTRATWRELIGRILLVLLVVSLVGLLLRRDLRGSLPARRDIIFVAGTLLLMVLVTRVLISALLAMGDAWGLQETELVLLMIPFASGAMLLRLVLDTESALVYALLFSLLVLGFFERAELFLPFILISCITGGLTLRQAKTRMSVLRSGVLVGLTHILIALGVLLLTAQSLNGWTLFEACAFAFGGGVLSGFLVTILLPLTESALGYTTDIKLLELASLENPLLKQLQLKSPGSFHHSMMVGSLNEAAAEAIGARALLARVGAYYHDIGKMKNPQYFAENQSGDNPHNRLKPHMSALILKAHVKDGLDMAYQHGLPQDIVDFIATHHGTSRIEYFYHKAKEQLASGMPEVREADFRYPGPKPQTREMGICMIADTVEAATKAMPDKTPDRLRVKVTQLINAKFADGQFDECDLTLKDLNAIAEALLRVLNGIYHQRPQYPSARKTKKAKKEPKPKPPPEADGQDKAPEPPANETDDSTSPPTSATQDAAPSEDAPPEVAASTEDEEGGDVVNILSAKNLRATK